MAQRGLTSSVFAIVVFGFFITQISSSAFLPAMLVTARYFNQTAHSIQFTLSIFFMGYGVGQFIWGSLSDWLGRKPVYCTAFLIYIVAGCFISVAHVPLVFFLAYAVFGFAAACFTSVGNATIRDVYSKDDIPKKISIVGVVMGAGPMLGAALGTMLTQYFGWREVFYVLTFIGILLFLFYIACVPETFALPPKSERKSFFSRLALLFSNGQFMVSVLVLAASFGAFIAFLNAAPIMFSRVFLLNETLSGWLLTVCSLCYLLGAGSVFVFVRRIDIFNLVSIAIALFVLSCCVLLLDAVFFQKTFVLAILSFMLGLFALGALVPLGKSSCMTSTSSYPGTTASMMKGLQTASAILFASLVAILDSGHLLSFVFVWGGCGLLLLVTIFCRYAMNASK